MSENKILLIKTCLEDLSSELLISIFDYLTSIEVLIAFFNLNKRIRLTICYYLQLGYRLTQFNLQDTNYLTYKIFCHDILPNLKSTITSFQLGSNYYFGQIDYFNQYQLMRLDSLTMRLIDPNLANDILQKFLNYNRLQWFDKINLIIDEETKGWNEQMSFCVQNIPVRELKIIGKVPYVFAQHLMTGCYSITHLTIHLKFDHDLLPLLYYLPNLIECNAYVDHRGRDISNDLTLLEPLPALKHFKYEGLMSPIYLRRLIIEINLHIEHLFIYTQDYQWPFHSSEGFCWDFFDCLHDLQRFHFYIRLMTSDSFNKLRPYFTDTKYLINRKLCHNIACVVSKDIGQIFSLPFEFNHFEIFDENIFSQIQYIKNEKNNSNENYWSNIEHLTLHMNIYDRSLLQLIKEKFTKVCATDYQVPHFSLIPQENELHQFEIELSTIKKLIIRDSVKHGCHVPQPLFLLTSNLIELEIDHFYLMQIVSMVSKQTQSCMLTAFSRLHRVTVRQFDERITDYFFSYFSHIKIFALIFATYKMQVYRTKLPFLDDLLKSMSHLISLKLEHIRKPQYYQDYIEMQKNVEEKFSEYYSKSTYWCKWYDDQTQLHNRYATFFFST
ncbi:unnamed protein product [Rotaria socialis]|uniref:F-box domain-containing protein n=1 Tax=Rotaria socialis TaxID=392032 RepID=A0A820W845_9BILA|nr:unnamed protein product [Rotaria socialis]CAF4513104.1 unnamed protein product [Rotaria socialis]